MESSWWIIKAYVDDITAKIESKSLMFNFLLLSKKWFIKIITKQKYDRCIYLNLTKYLLKLNGLRNASELALTSPTFKGKFIYWL